MPAFAQTRETFIAAPPDAVRRFVRDLRAWQRWSPWEGMDSDLQRTYSGAEEGVGARYAWAGKKSGQGEMAITAAEEAHIDLDLTFKKPFAAENKVVFSFVAEGEGTRVRWTMSGHRNPLLAALGWLFLDGVVGKDFDRGLAQLKRCAERASTSA